MSSSNKSKSRSTGNKPLQIKEILAPSASSVHPQTLKANAANKQFQLRQTKKLTKKTDINEKGAVTSSGVLRNPKNSRSNRGYDKSMSDTVAAFESENPFYRPLNQKSAIKTAEKKGPGRVRAMIADIEKGFKKGGNKTRKNKKSKKSKTRSKRC